MARALASSGKIGKRIERTRRKTEERRLTLNLPERILAAGDGCFWDRIEPLRKAMTRRRACSTGGKPNQSRIEGEVGDEEGVVAQPHGDGEKTEEETNWNDDDEPG